MLNSPNTQTTKNSGKVNVTAALAKITDGDSSDTCKLLRDEILDGAPTTVYTEEMKSKDGASVGTIWIAKITGAVVKQDVEVDMGTEGKGRQIITFTYKK